MHSQRRSPHNESAISKLLNEALKKAPACRGAKFGPIIQSDIPGDWTAYLQGNPSGSCQRAFIAVRSQLQERISITPYEKDFY